MATPVAEPQVPRRENPPQNAPEQQPKRARRWLKILLIMLVALGFAAAVVQTGVIPWPGGQSASKGAPEFHCPMHPAVVSDRPGSCPICSMDLVPIGEGISAGDTTAKSTVPGLAVVSITPQTRQLMGLKLGAVEKRPLAREVRTSARIVADETRLWRVATKVEGWVDQLFIAYTGQEVNEGDPLLTFYSPDLVSAQAEYLAALRAGGGSLAESARRRLELWDISADQIERLERDGKVEKNLTLYAPAGGVVTSRDVLAGQKIMPGDPLMVIADLSVVWGDADIYQSDLPYVKMGMPLELGLPYWPGKIFDGKVIFVSPTLDPSTRTLGARLEISNPKGLLKPGMFGDAKLHYILGEKLSIPASAVMIGGRRTYAFRDLGDGHLVPVEIEIGARSDDYYELLKGLAEGERVVVSANFLVDSESNLKAALEAMTGSGPAAGDASGPPVDEVAGDTLPKLVPVYLEIQKALAADDLSKAATGAGSVRDVRLKSLETIAAATDLTQARAGFYELSRSILPAVEKAGAPEGQPLYRLYCPMALDNKGAEWLQSSTAVRNPYFGAWMLECGEVKGQIPGKAQVPTGEKPPAKDKMPKTDPHAGHIR